MKRLYLLFVILTISLTATLADSWTDVTSRFVTNAGFDNGTYEGWKLESSAQTVGTTSGCMRFFSGTCKLTQQLDGLTKGRYRLRVQGFYRTTNPENAYPAYTNGTEQVTAYIIAGNERKKLNSLFYNSLNYDTGGCWTADGMSFYPNGSGASASFFNQGLYWNELEFETEGSATIGIVCESAEYNNWCVFDNFTLEYATSGGSKSWVDVTSRYLQNTGFDNNDGEGWTWENGAGPTARSECFEFFNGWFDFYQTVKDLPQGHYRLSVQGFYRCKNNESSWISGDYDDYMAGTQNITGYMYAGDNQQQLRSVYSESLDNWYNGSWSRDGKYYPNTMESARYCFDRDLYWNTMEFDGGGNIDIGMRCMESQQSNWCIFDNFKLEFYTDMIPVTGISIKLAGKELIVGETTKATANIEPAIATLPFVNWSTSNDRVATIDNNGQITATGSGTATITATAADGSGVTSTVTITVSHNKATAGSIVINEIMPSNVDEYISPAFNFDGWVELYNPTDKAVELAGVKVSDPADPTAVWTMPTTMGTIPAKGYKLVWFDSNDISPTNATWKLNIDGGTIVFTAANGQEIARQQYPAALERVSYARQTDGSDNWGYCGTPSPETTNNGTKLLSEQLAAPVVDQPSQLFTGTISVNVTIPSGCTLRYTTDGTLPTLTNGETSINGRFTIDRTQSMRFRLFANSKLPSRVSTRSYIYNVEGSTLPVISVVTDPNFLYSKEYGVFETGPNGRPGNGKSYNCNWNMNWERPVNFSYITSDGQMVLNQDVNLEMAGGWSRADWPHSFKLKGNKEMGGQKNLQYPFFDQKPYIRNRTLQIRNGGGDVGSGRFKDPALQYLVMSSGIDVDGQSYQPIVEYINGEPIGLLNMREPNNKHYVYANYGWDDDEIDQFEMSPDSGYVQKCGTKESFNNLMALSANAANANTYSQICQLLDIDAFINYMAVELYLCNWDWPQNNVKGFRHRDNGRFRFVLFDLDNAFSFWSDGKMWGTPPFQTFFNKENNYTYDQLYPTSLGCITEDIEFVRLFRQLLQNDTFRRRFIDAYCIVGGSVFEAGRVERIVDNLASKVISTWPGTENTANQIKNNLNGRNYDAVRLMKESQYFNIGNSNQQQVTISCNVDGARLFINDQEIPTGQFSGYLFPPVKLRAENVAGMEFNGWGTPDGHMFTNSQTFSLPSGTTEIVANYRKMTAREQQAKPIIPVRINEISGANDSYINEYFKKDDWVELYNTTSEPVDVEGMYLSDKADNVTRYRITKGNTTANTIIPAHGHLIIWCDKRETTDNGLHASFKIADDGGLLILTAADKSWQDVMNYGEHDSRTTIGRYPDGTDNVYAMNQATIAKSNRYSSYLTAVEQTGLPVVDGIKQATANSTRLSIAYGSGQLIVMGNTDGGAEVSVYGSNGVLVQQATVNIVGGSTRLDVNNLGQGFYIAKVTHENGAKSSCRFVK